MAARTLDHVPPRPDGAKPVVLHAYLLGNSCPPGGIVLDVFAGGGAAAFVHGAGCGWETLTPSVDGTDYHRQRME